MDGRLRGISRLTLGRMFEATVRNRSNKLVFQQEVAEAFRVNADVGALFVALGVRNGELAAGAVGRRLGRLDLLIGVVDQILLVRHG